MDQQGTQIGVSESTRYSNRSTFIFYTQIESTGTTQLGV